MTKLEHEDEVIVVGHRSYNGMNSAEMPGIQMSLGRDSEFNSYYINMGVVNTNDSYYHPISKLL